jgi:hypothetical protein
MNSSLLRYAFIDESGTPGADHGTHFLVIAILTTNQPRSLELPVRRALKKYGRFLSSGELKASRIKEVANLRMLEEISEQDIQIIAVLVNQHEIDDAPEDSEEIYRIAMTTAIHHLVERYPKVQISLDRRYTNENLRDMLEQQIREGLQDLQHTVVLIKQENSYIRKELQAADAVAWAFFQKYERGNTRFFDVIESKVILEEVVNFM